MMETDEPTNEIVANYHDMIKVLDFNIEQIGHMVIFLFGEIAEREHDRAHVLLDLIFREWHPRFTGELN